MLLSFIGQSSAKDMVSCDMSSSQQNQAMTGMGHEMMAHTQSMSTFKDNSENMTHQMNLSSSDKCCEECYCYTTSCHQVAALFEYTITSQLFELEQPHALPVLKPNSQYLSYLFKPPIYS